MAVPIVYRKSKENTLVNYDFIDIASGTGYILFYGGMSYRNDVTQSGAGLLSNQTFYSSPQYTQGNTTSSTWGKRATFNFDVLINRQFTFKGTAIINIPFYIHDFGGGSNSTIGAVASGVYKYDGTTETQIGYASGAMYSNGVGTFAYNDTLQVTIPQTIFKKGDYLRLKTECWCRTVSTEGGVWILHDPKDRPTVSGALTGALTLQMPIKLNL